MNAGTSDRRRSQALALLAVAGVVAAFFWPSLKPELVLFANDGPLGANKALADSLPEGFTGLWSPLTWTGGWTGSALPTLTYALLWVLGPVGFAKFYAPICVALLGMSVWVLLWRLGLRPSVCLVGGIAAALNMNFLSYACWGLGTLNLCMAWVSLALAALVSDGLGSRRWPLAGVAVGMSVMEGFDNGAIMSLYISAFVLFLAWRGHATAARDVGRSAAALAKVALAAALVAAHALTMLTGTQIKGIVGTAQDRQARDANWHFATQWSLPKIESLGILVAGAFGYGMPEMYGKSADAVGGANYWGAVGQDIDWETYLRSPNPDPAKAPAKTLRFTGAGFYVGVFVAITALWALLQAARGAAGSLDAGERRQVWFWTATAGISLLLAFGRHAPFYQFIYALPYFSTIRNPVKFLHPFSLAIVILSAYGFEALWRRAAHQRSSPALALRAHWTAWWQAASSFERRWMHGLAIGIGLSVLATMLYAASRVELERHLQRVAFSPELARSVAGFSVRQVAWFALTFAVSSGVFALLLSGWFHGRRARWGPIAVALLVSGDLVRASLPWRVHYDYQTKYASNTIIDLLRQRPHERRVTSPPLPMPPELVYFRSMIYYQDWLQNLFPFYGIQSLDIIQMPRVPEEYVAYNQALVSSLARLWQLTNTRFVLLPLGYLDALNEQLDPVQKRFRLHTAFEFYQLRTNGPILLRTNTTGPFALFEFAGALPRAKVYTHWQASTNDTRTLQQLANPAFDPHSTVLVADSAIGTPTTSATNQPAGGVEFERYEPMRIRLRATATAPSLLLVNDRFDPQWRVTVNGTAAPLLRCNYLMRGVALQPGQHTIEFRFQQPPGSLWLSLASIAAAVVACGVLACGRCSRRASPGAAAAGASKPAQPCGPKPPTA
jgi:hypothetical protein